MAIGKKIDWMQSSVLALVVAASVWAVSWLAGFFGQGVGELFVSVPATSVLTGTVGTKILGFIGGIVPIGDLGSMAWLTLAISSLVVVILGEQVMDRIKLPVLKLPFLKQNTQRLASVIIYGAIPISAAFMLISGFGVPSITQIIGVLVHTIAVSFVAVSFANILKLKI